MTLGRKMAWQSGATVVGLLLVSAASLWGINGLTADYGVALDAYQELRHVYEIRSHLQAASKLLSSDPPNRELASVAVRDARTAFNGYAGRGPDALDTLSLVPSLAVPPPLTGPHLQQKQQVEARLQDAWARLRNSAVPPTDFGRGADLVAV